MFIVVCEKLSGSVTVVLISLHDLDLLIDVT